MKSKIRKYVLNHLTDDTHHFELDSEYADSLGISFDELRSILLQLSSEGAFSAFDYGDAVLCERFPPCTVPYNQES